MIDPLLTVLQEESDMVHQLQFFSVLNMVLGKFCKVFKKASNELTGRLSKSLVCTIKLGEGTRKVNTVLLKILRLKYGNSTVVSSQSTVRENQSLHSLHSIAVAEVLWIVVESQVRCTYNTGLRGGREGEHYLLMHFGFGQKKYTTLSQNNTRLTRSGNSPSKLLLKI